MVFTGTGPFCQSWVIDLRGWLHTEVLLLALDVLNDEAHPLGLEVNWQKTKIQSTINLATTPSSSRLPSPHVATYPGNRYPAS